MVTTNGGFMSKKKEHPMQPIILDKHGIARFKENSIVRYLIDNGNISLNDIEILQFSKEDYEQFNQLLGYSVSGFGDLNYVRKKTVEKADYLVEELLKSKKR